MSISITMLGELAIYLDGKPIDLPPSKRTRALLAFLAMTARPHRRDRLCEVFWETPDDPRGALRWSLSKIRPLVNDADLERLVADRERVTLLTDDIDIDIKSIANMTSTNDALSAEILREMCEKLKEPLLDGVDLPEQEFFKQWLQGERAEIDRLRCKLMEKLSRHPDTPLLEKLKWTESWEALDPYNPHAATQLLNQLTLCGQTQNAAHLEPKLIKRFRNAGIPWPSEQSTHSTNAGNSADIAKTEEPEAKRELLTRQKIMFCKASDGARIAYASIGKGFPILKAANWLSHLEHDWDAPVWSPLFRQLALNHHLIRYDERGNGLSDWDVSDISFESFVTDLETVADASKLDKFALLGISQGAAVSIEYSIRHPERVSHLILFGGYDTGWRIGASESTIREREAIMTLTATGWGQDNPAYRQIFSSTFMPSASPSDLAWFNEFQRLTTSPENAVRFLSVFGDIDVRDQLKKVSVPTLVIHSRGDQRIPVSVGRDIAATIPNAQFVSLESDGHLLLGSEPSSKVFVDTVKEFIANT